MQPAFRFTDRADAGRQLAGKLAEYAGREDVLVLGLPRGGVPVAAIVADALSAPLDVMIVRKLGVPAQPELAMGAIASGGALVANTDVIKQAGVTEADIAAVMERERAELERRERMYRGARAFSDVTGKAVIVVDDGIATGATLRAAVQALRRYAPREIVVAVPVAPPRVQQGSLQGANRFIAVLQPAPFFAVGQWYRDFDQVPDEDVTRLLQGHHGDG